MKTIYFKFIAGFLGIIAVTVFVGYPSARNNAKKLLSNTDSVIANVFSSAKDLSGQGNKLSSNENAASVQNNEIQIELQSLKQEINALKEEISSLKKGNKQKQQDKVSAQEDYQENQNSNVLNIDVSSTAAVSTKNATAAFQFCKFGTSKAPQHSGVILNEIAWMGSVKSSSDEWIELKNISGQETDLSNWQFIAKDGQIKINLKELKNPKLKSGAFALLERTDGDSIAGVSADLIYKGGLSNSGEKLRLFNADCGLIDEVSAGLSWPAGNNATKQTMERDSSGFGWHTSVISGGTPRRENSQPVVYSGGGGGGGVAANNQQPAADNIPESPKFYAMAINEIMYDAFGSDAGREWIEIFNRSTSTVDLSNFKLSEGRTNHGLALKQGDKNISPGSYAIISNGFDKFKIDYPDCSSTIFESSFSLNNGAGTIIFKNGDLQIDEASYASSTGANDNGKSLQLIDGVWKESAPTPGQENVADTLAESPVNIATTATAQFSFAPISPKIGDVITFDASLSTVSTGTINLYEWQFGDGAGATSTSATSTHIYETSGDYAVQLVVFGNNGVSSTAVSNISISPIPIADAPFNPTSTQETISVADHIVISEIYPDKTGNNFDFVELYNPTGDPISLNNYSLKIQKGVATTTSSLASFSSGNSIAAKSFFLIGFDNYKNSSNIPADVSRSYSLPTTEAAEIFLMNDSAIIDQAGYNPTNLSAGQSLERKAYSNGACFSSQGDGELLGNGCDTNNDANDFEIRSIANPQNSASPIEPAAAVETSPLPDNSTSTDATPTII